jgi:erythronate-4-phosphate dehydrogenase
MVTLLIDDHIPFIKGVLESYAKVIYVESGKIRRAQALEADGLIIRTRTRCDASLLDGSPVKFIASATIGFDHIDTEYCNSNGISWFYAPGCNASSVRQYIASVFSVLVLKHNYNPEGKRIGIVGYGHVGTRVAQLASAFGMEPILNDPPRQRKEGGKGYVSINEIKESCDIITLHVPLTFEGQDKTYHMADERFFDGLANKPLLINTSRGSVVDTNAVKKAIHYGHISGYVADVWENEPDIDTDLLAMTMIATPHIAGYSIEGKANGTAACVRAAGKHFGWDTEQWYPSPLPLPEHPDIVLKTAGKSQERIIPEAILASYDVTADDQPFRDDPFQFEHLRNHYPHHREFNAFTVSAPSLSPALKQLIKALGFNV